MKKWLIILLAVAVVGATIGTVAFLSSREEMSETAIETDVAIKDSEGTVILSSEDIVDVQIVKNSGDSFIELVLTKKGEKKYNSVIDKLLYEGIDDEEFYVFVEDAEEFSYIANKYIDERKVIISNGISAEEAEKCLALFKKTEGPQQTPSPTPNLNQKKEDDFIKYVKQQLGVPDDPNITYKIGEEYIWEAAGNARLVSVVFEQNGEVVAGADCAADTGEIARSIIAYMPPETSAPNGYFTYTNSIGKYSVDIPNGYEKLWEADGCAGFMGPNYCCDIQVYNVDMPDGISSNDELYNYLYSELEIDTTYARNAGSYFVFSGYYDTQIVYLKYKPNNNGTYTWLKLVYAKSDKEKFDDIVTHVAGSLR